MKKEIMFCLIIVLGIIMCIYSALINVFPLVIFWGAITIIYSLIFLSVILNLNQRSKE
jgi:hypothetical protein